MKLQCKRLGIFINIFRDIIFTHFSFSSKKEFIDYFLEFGIIGVQLLGGVQIFVTPRNAACQASLSFTISQSLLKFISIELLMPSNHLILCHPRLVLPEIFPSIKVFSNKLTFGMWWPRYCRFSFSIRSFQ